MKWPRAAGSILAAAKLEDRLPVVLYQAAKCRARENTQHPPQTAAAPGGGNAFPRRRHDPGLLTQNPAKIALFPEGAGLPYEVVPVDTSRGEQRTSAFRAINPNGCTGDRRYGWSRRQEGAGVRFHRNPALPRRENRPAPRPSRRTVPSCSPGCCSSPPGSGHSLAKPYISSSPPPRGSATR